MGAFCYPHEDIEKKAQTSFEWWKQRKKHQAEGFKAKM